MFWYWDSELALLSLCLLAAPPPSSQIHALIHLWHHLTHFTRLILSSSCVFAPQVISFAPVLFARRKDHSFTCLFIFIFIFLLLSFCHSSISFSLSHYTSLSSFHFILLSLNQLLALSHFVFLPVCNCAADSFSPFRLLSFPALPLWRLMMMFHFYIYMTFQALI